ncbi:MAG TPA: hypothetical protein VFT72_17635 [Opitutaceae bacterium]|nr:hypothetical protein [Opitutaceae bacterium]
MVEPPHDFSATAPASVLQDAAWNQTTLTMYRDNPFRALGASVLSHNREVMKRGDELRLAVRLGLPTANWAFAPSVPALGETTRTALQILQEAPRRLVAEFFWFWPESYPNAAPDVALDHLARGDSAAAIAEWASKKSADNVGVLHNLAVYHHLMALEQEQADTQLPREDLSAWWGAALRYWALIADNDELWQRVEARVAALDDAQLPPGSAAVLRKLLPHLLGSIQARLALKYAEARKALSAAEHVALLGQIHDQPADARRALEQAVRPVLQRLNARLEQAWKPLKSDALEAIKHAGELVENCLPDIHLLNTLCEAESELCVEATTRFANRVAEELHASRLNSSHAGEALAPLAYVLSLPLSRETHARVQRVFDEILENSLNSLSSGKEGEPTYARLFHVLSEQIVPRFFSLNVGAVSQRECGEVLANLLRRVARDALNERDDVEFALHAYKSLLLLPCEQSVWSKREAEKEAFQRTVDLRRQKEVRLHFGEDELRVFGRGIVWKGKFFAVEDILAVRLGRRAAASSGPARESYVVAWRSPEGEYVLDQAQVFADEVKAPELYAKIADALMFFVVPQLASRLAAAIQSGEALDLNGTGVTREGVWLETGTRLFKREERVPLQKVTHRVEEGFMIMASVENPKLQTRHAVAETWNAVVMGDVIEALTKQASAGS